MNFNQVHPSEVLIWEAHVNIASTAVVQTGDESSSRHYLLAFSLATRVS